MHLAAPNNWILIYILNFTYGFSGTKKKDDEFGNQKR